MRIGSLFAGIGGFDLAARWMGWETKWYSEIDPYACRVMEKHFGETDISNPNGGGLQVGAERYGQALQDTTNGNTCGRNPHGRCGAYNVGDITQWTPTVRDAVDIVCGGFPCQPVSLAGKRKAQDDERWLWPEFARVLGVLRPRYVVIENVPGLRSRGMADVLRDLTQIGYDAEWTSLSAADVGAPHRRERVWIVAYSSSDRRQSGDGRRTLPDKDGDGASSLREPQQQPRVGSGGPVADPSLKQRDGRVCGVGWWKREPQEALRHAGRGRWEEDGVSIPESLLGRVAHGVPSWVDRLKCLGNAIVPQCAYEIFKRLI